ncbi:MAG: ectoine/hydroxyectoine ABC transporter permease subunit EhuD [Streptosporangiales bacterium]|nr:ectoine/hydroxyectoine ABC transporter permease subunit EhuD [Streptosporangiales bacterium]
MQWDWNYAADIMPRLLDGLVVTVSATLVGYLIAVVLGLAIALLRRSDNRAVSGTVRWIMEFIRSTPLLVQLFFIFFVLPSFGVVLSAFTAGVIGLGLHYAAYTSEVYRAGIEAVPKGQWEAATALSLSPGRTWFGVVLPQAVPKVIPALGNYLIAMFKDSPMLFGITVVEMLGAAYQIGAETFRYLEPMTIVGVLFVVVSIPASILFRYLERRYGH